MLDASASATVVAKLDAYLAGGGASQAGPAIGGGVPSDAGKPSFDIQGHLAPAHQAALDSMHPQHGANAMAQSSEALNQRLTGAGVTRVEGMDPFQRLESLRHDMVAKLAERQDVDHRVASGMTDASDPAIVAERQQQLAEMLVLQVEMNHAAFAVQLVAKVVEHGTSGVRTVLQTQI